jgi:hypothetical protein
MGFYKMLMQINLKISVLPSKYVKSMDYMHLSISVYECMKSNFGRVFCRKEYQEHSCMPSSQKKALSFNRAFVAGRGIEPWSAVADMNPALKNLKSQVIF